MLIYIEQWCSTFFGSGLDGSALSICGSVPAGDPYSAMELVWWTPSSHAKEVVG